MDVVQGIDALDAGHGRLFFVIGVFDGLHRGHEYLLRELAAAAQARDARPAVITFDHHPDEILTGKAPPLLCDPAERLSRLEAAGVAVTVVQHFDRALRETPYDDFVRRIAGRVALAGFLMTPESAFGYERRGTPETVAALGRTMGFDVVVVPQFRDGTGSVIQSSAIRDAIEHGRLAEAAVRMGRLYAVTGTAVGEGRATRLAFPMPVALPPPGQYEVGIGDQGEWMDDRVQRTAEVTEHRDLLVPGLDPGARHRVSFLPG